MVQTSFRLLPTAVLPSINSSAVFPPGDPRQKKKLIFFVSSSRARAVVSAKVRRFKTKKVQESATPLFNLFASFYHPHSSVRLF